MEGLWIETSSILTETIVGEWEQKW